MSKLSKASMKILKIIRDNPGLDGDQIRHGHAEGNSQTSNNIKLLEQHDYIVWGNPLAISPITGWWLTPKGKDVLKYG